MCIIIKSSNFFLLWSRNKYHQLHSLVKTEKETERRPQAIESDNWSRFCELSPFHVSMSVCVHVFHMFSKWPGWWDFMDIVCLIFLKDTGSQHICCTYVFYSVFAPFQQWSLSLSSGNCAVDVSVRTGRLLLCIL